MNLNGGMDHGFHNGYKLKDHGNRVGFIVADIIIEYLSLCTVKYLRGLNSP